MNNYINVIRNFLKSIASFRVRNEREIYALKNSFLTPGVVRNDDKKGASFLTKCKPYLLLLLSLCISSIAMAQPDPGGDVDVPIDGGLSLLIAAGAGYGAKQLRKKKKIITSTPFEYKMDGKDI